MAPIPEGKDAADMIGRKAPDPSPAPVDQDHPDHVAPAPDAVPVAGTGEPS